MNDLNYPYPSRRGLVYAANGMAASSQHLASQAGLDILKKGGSAVDAGIAMAMALTVVEPCSNGIGGDAFCIVWDKHKLHGLNASGPAPMAISIPKVRALGYKEMPVLGMVSTTVPGIPAAWGELSRRFGKLPMKDLAAPAVSYAQEGHIVSPVAAAIWKDFYEKIRREPDSLVFSPWLEAFAPNNKPPGPGDLWRCPEMAESLRVIAETGGDDFYRGGLASAISDFFQKNGGFLRKEDLASYKPQRAEPVSVSYRGHEIWELPPNGQGLVALMALGILEGLEMEGRDKAGDWHKRIEAVKLAFSDGMGHITDPDYMGVDIKELLDLAESRRRMITPSAWEPRPLPLKEKGTVYLCAADKEGMMVSYIQSNFYGFGSGVVIPGTGISIQNRGLGFSLDENHINALNPGKRSYHTIIPGFLTKNGLPLGPFGLMGGFMQPQGHTQIIANMLDYGLNPQAALDAPRWQWVKGREVLLEPGVPEDTAKDLEKRGHIISYAKDCLSFGRGQIILKNPGGGYMGATEPRADGGVAAY